MNELDIINEWLDSESKFFKENGIFYKQSGADKRLPFDVYFKRINFYLATQSDRSIAGFTFMINKATHKIKEVSFWIDFGKKEFFTIDFHNPNCFDKIKKTIKID